MNFKTNARYKRVLDYIRDNPGHDTDMITAGLGENRAKVRNAFKVLSRHGKIEAIGRPPRYYSRVPAAETVS